MPVAAAAVLGLAALAAQAQPAVPPAADPGVILRPPVVPPPPPPAPPRDPLERPPPPAAEAVAVPQLRFVLRQVVTGESGLLTDAQLRATWAGLVGREVGLEELRGIVAAINELYWREGHYAAMATLPPQRIAEGVLRIELVEGRVQRLTVDGLDPAVQPLARSVFDLQPGVLFVGPQLQQRLARFNRGVETRFFATLRPGTEPGTTEVVAEVELPPRFDMSAALHNEASDAVGREQLELVANARRLLGGADRLNLTAQRSQGLTQLALAYSTPVNRFGTRLAGSVAQGRTQTVGGGLGGLDVDGSSRVFGLTLTHPLPAWRGLDVDLSAGLQRTRTETEVAGFPIGESETALRTLAAFAVWRHPRHVASAYLAFNRASHRSPGQAERSVSTQLLNASWAWLYSPQWWFAARAGMQRSAEVDIPGALKFSLGNPGDVRGYPGSTIFGDEGHFLVLEAHRRFGERLEAYAFVDHGRVSTQGVPDKTLRSVGAGAVYRWSPTLVASASLARPLTEVVAEQDNVRLLFRLAWQFY
jgi:hemolysin activation/secretion protein